MEPVTEEDYVALAKLRYELRVFLAFSEEAARAEGVEPRQHQLLLAIKGFEGGPPSVGDLARRLLLKPHSAAELVKRSADQGLVATSRAAHDGRVVHVRVLPHGERILARLSVAHRAELRTLAPELVATLRAVVGEAA